MVMRSNFQLLLLLCTIAVTAHAQNDQPPSLNIGDPAPPLRVREWIKGTPVQRFEKGNVYVVEFWATWCKPCIAAMNHLSVLAAEYKDRVTIIGIEVYEQKTTFPEKVKAFVDSLWHRMDYHVAAEDSNFMVAGWLEAAGGGGIPRSFVVNEKGTVAWIGYPKALDDILPKIVNNTWNIKQALAKRNLERHLNELDDSLHYELLRYMGFSGRPDEPWKPDSALLMINEIVKNEPKLKYAPRIAFNTFSSLVKTNPHKAYAYGKVAMMTPPYDDLTYDANDAIIGAIGKYSDSLNFPTEIYQLGAEAYQVQIDRFPYPEIADFSRSYNQMAAWYRRANDKSKAIDSQKKAIEALKIKKGFSANEMAAFESRLQQYKNL